jgi:hypothetical protein
VAQRVVHQIGEHALDEPHLGQHDGQAVGLDADAVDFQAHLRARRGRGEPLHDIVGEFGDGKRLALQYHVLRFEPREFQQIGHQPRQAGAVPRRGFEVVLRLGGVELALAQQQQLEVTLHRSQRRAQVVRDLLQRLVALAQRARELHFEFARARGQRIGLGGARGQPDHQRRQRAADGQQQHQRRHPQRAVVGGQLRHPRQQQSGGQRHRSQRPRDVQQRQRRRGAGGLQPALRSANL